MRGRAASAAFAAAGALDDGNSASALAYDACFGRPSDTEGGLADDGARHVALCSEVWELDPYALRGPTG